MRGEIQPIALESYFVAHRRRKLLIRANEALIAAHRKRIKGQKFNALYGIIKQLLVCVPVA